MSNISVRLPPDVEKGLEDEIRLSARSRSDLVREAVSEYLARRQKERIIEDMRQAARMLYSHSREKDDGIATAEQGVSDWLESIEREEQASGINPDEKWWD
ncbi:MAG: ribbon-helix-helix protein, CopG family [Wenzhouxiangella sp.]|jgi:metal-responsive CopG/Arc/MetJ family transcriptional regulator|nr:ribbon-helix-helix protein, CopG family [Wenzhouxiangella sp.]